MRRPAAFSLFVVSTVLIGIVSAASSGATSGVEPLQRDFQTSSAPRLYDGPPLTLAGGLALVWFLRKRRGQPSL